jgi:hypothetical protein
VAGESFIDGIVDDFVDKMVQTTLSGRPDIHPRTLADGFETLENLDVLSPVIFGIFLRF